MAKKSGKAKGTGVGIVTFGAAFALISILFHPGSFGGFLLTALASGLIGGIVGIMGSGLDTTTHNKQDASLDMVSQDTGNADVDAVLEKGRALISEIRSENSLIPDSTLSAQPDALEAECAQVFSIVYDKPGKISQIRKFMEYYLPTTLKMVKGYRMLDERKVPGQEAAQVKQRISEVIDTVIQAAHKLKENLYQDDVLDINTDIDVLEQMLKRDGLTESDLRQVEAQARRAAQLDQAVYEAEKQRRRQAETPSVPTMNGGTYYASGSAAAQAMQKKQ